MVYRNPIVDERPNYRTVEEPDSCANCRFMQFESDLEDEDDADQISLADYDESCKWLCAKGEEDRHCNQEHTVCDDHERRAA